jgi:thiol:disulfide interchange protein DsbD
MVNASQAAHTEVRLLLSANPVQPGTTIWAGFDLTMAPGWHTYWKNSGDSGIPTQIKWSLPAGVTAGEIEWPLPKKLPPAEVTTYAYEGETMLLVPLTLASNMNPGSIRLSAQVSWLECQDQCVPGATNISATLTVGEANQPTPEAALIESWRKKVPQSSQDWTVTAMWEKPANDDTRPLLIQGRYIGPPEQGAAGIAEFFPDANDNYEIQSATVKVPDANSDFSLEKNVKKYAGNWPTEISGVLASADSSYAFAVELPVSDLPLAMAKASLPPQNGAELPTMAASTVSTPLAQPLWRMLIYALIGGLILNIMPCVLPVIALKILGFVNEGKSDPGRVRLLGVVYAIGVLVSFVTLALIVIGVKSVGHQAAWGMQFGSPVFLVCLATLVTLVALNLFGVFEVTLGSRAMNTAGELASRHGASGAFFNGVLATTLATPCTAPFLAPALGFAFAQGTPIIILVFLTVGLGLAAPYILLSWNPAWLKYLPKPGAWMEKFKITMGFPMLATVMWLFYIASSSYGKDVAWLGGFLVIVSLAAWIYGEFVQRGRRHQTLAAMIALVLLAIGYFAILENELNWRTPRDVAETSEPVDHSPDAITWEPWSPDAIAKAQSAGQPVIVDFTADWCLTCQVNKKSSIEIPSVRQKLKAINALTLVGDYTRFPERMTEELQRFGRAGVPLVLVYPGKPEANPVALPEILTPSTVLDALDRAVK